MFSFLKKISVPWTIWRLSLVERQCVMTGCRFNFTVFLFHRPKMDLKGFLSFALLHRFQFNQPQWKRKTKPNNPINKEVTCWTLSQAPRCVFLNAHHHHHPSLCVLNALAVITYALILSIHILNTWRCFDCLPSPWALIDSFQTNFPFLP